MAKGLKALEVIGGNYLGTDQDNSKTISLRITLNQLIP
jgi:hypothetical protein